MTWLASRFRSIPSFELSEPYAKTFVLDTNVLVHNPQALFDFEDNRIVIPISVIEELDNLKYINTIQEFAW